LTAPVCANVATHSAAAVDTRTGGVLAEVTVEAAPEGCEALVQFANEHQGLRAWAIEGTGATASAWPGRVVSFESNSHRARTACTPDPED
jgi:hypothetical protein